MARSPLRLRDLRAYAVGRSLFAPRTLAAAIERLGFVQADPIRAPARAQDLILRHRVRNYRAGDLEALYPDLDVEEDLFVAYGFLPRRHLALMHPRVPPGRWDRSLQQLSDRVLEYVEAEREAHPRDVQLHFGLGTVTNYWGGRSNATTHLLDQMHYRGLLRVVRRRAGVRVYGSPRNPEGESRRLAPSVQAAGLLDLAVAKYAPVPAVGLGQLASRLRHAAPRLANELRTAAKRARCDLPHETVEGVDWYWPAGEDPREQARERLQSVRLLAPFDPVVWQRDRFELFHGWPYRFEAYTPVKKRQRGYYALPLLWRDDVVGWANLTVKGGALMADLGYVSGRAPEGRAFHDALDAELESMRAFLEEREARA